MISVKLFGQRSTTPVIPQEFKSTRSTDAIVSVIACRCQKHVVTFGASLAGRVSNLNDEIRIEYKGKIFKTYISTPGVYHIVRKNEESDDKLVLIKSTESACYHCRADFFSPIPLYEGL